MSLAFDPLSIDCPACPAKVGEWCFVHWPAPYSYQEIDFTHEQRIVYHNSEGRESTKAKWDEAVEKWGGV